MKKAMAECFRVLKPGRWLSLCYHDTSEGTWALVQDIMAEVGFVVDKTDSTLFIDTGQKSFNQTDRRQDHEAGPGAELPQAQGRRVRHHPPGRWSHVRRAWHPGHPGFPDIPSGSHEGPHLRRTREPDGPSGQDGGPRLQRPPAERGRGGPGAGQGEPVRQQGARPLRLPHLQPLVSQGDRRRGGPAEQEKEDAAAARLEKYMAAHLRKHPEDEGVHYSDLFEQFLPVPSPTSRGGFWPTGSPNTSSRQPMAPGVLPPTSKNESRRPPCVRPARCGGSSGSPTP